MSDSFLFYRSFEEVISQIPDAETQLKFYKALIAYGLEGADTEFSYPLNLAFVQMKACISSAQAKHEKRVEAGRNGGKNGKGVSKNKGNTNAKKTKNNSKTIANNSKTIANDNVNDNDNDNDNVIIFYKDNYNAPTECAPLEAAHPSVQAKWEVVTDENGEKRFVKHEHEGADTT